MARKTNSREVRRPRTLVVGAGITEFWYLKHLKRIKGFRFELQPKLFGNESMHTINSRIEEALSVGASVICVFDEDVTQWNESERKKLEQLHRKYDADNRVIIAGSMPSIEYWFLLHFENTNRFFGTSAKVIEALRRYLANFDKREQYLRGDRWVGELVNGSRMDDARQRAMQFGNSGQSYSAMWRAIDKMESTEP